MKIAVEQNVLLEVLAKGGIGALSDESQSDSSNLAPLVKSIKLTATPSDLIAESFSTQLYTKYVRPLVDGDNSIDIKEGGFVLVQGKELVGWLSKQNECKIGLNFSKETKEVKETDESSKEAVENKDVVQKVGLLKLASKDNNKTGAKWSLESYDDALLPNPTEPTDFKTLFRIPEISKFKNALAGIEFSAKKKDESHVFDGFMFEMIEGKMYAGTTDALRCSVYDLSGIVTETSDFFKTNKIVIPVSSLSAMISQSVDGVEAVIDYSPEKNIAYFRQAGLTGRLVLPDQQVINKFPTLAKILCKTYAKLVSIPKAVLNNRLSTAAMVNKFSGLFIFKNDKLKIYTATESGLEPNTCDCAVNGLQSDKDFIWNIGHIGDILKFCKDKDINISATEDSKIARFESPTDPNIYMFVMRMKDPKYDNVTID